MKRIFHKDVFFSTLFVFLIYLIIEIAFPFNIHFLDPESHTKKDFELSDLFFSKLQKSEDKVLDTNIIIVNIGNYKRKEIAGQIKTILSYQPKVLGVDILFSEKKDVESDSLLIASLKGKKDSVVIANKFEYSTRDEHKIESIKKPLPELGMDSSAGFINLISKEEHSSVRYFKPRLEFNNIQYNSFPSEIVKLCDKAVFDKLIKRDNDAEIINYKKSNTNFLVLENNEIIPDDPRCNILKNKIVLLGFCGPDTTTRVLEDAHFTPLNGNISGRSFPDMYGVEIQAHIISMIIRDDYINDMSPFLLLIISFMVCYLHMVYFVKVFVKRHIWFHIIFKIIQLISAAAMLGISLFLFSVLKIKMEPSVIIIPILLSVDVLYFYDGIVKYLNKKFNYQTYFIQQHN
ncbi:MAG: CHASE2 domain-containing protein [Bacteroidia bacterium]